MTVIDDNIIKELTDTINSKEDFLDFSGCNTKDFTHGYHTYPAMMIPQLPRLFLDTVLKYKKVNSLFDPFSGSGTTLVEGVTHGISSIGIDLNPLSVLISRVKSRYIDQRELEQSSNNLLEDIYHSKEDFDNSKLQVTIPTFTNIEFWFKDYVITDLQIIKDVIYNKVTNTEIKEFMLVAFSETVHFVSNSRNSEFKMYRLSSKRLPLWHPDVFSVFAKFLLRNVSANKSMVVATGDAKVYWGSSMNLNMIDDNSLDLMITSPPYGDSHTTVAYGQFSRLSLQWLDLREFDDKLLDESSIKHIDQTLLGGKVLKGTEIELTNSPTLNKSLKKIAAVDVKRAKEVYQFYNDLDATLDEFVRVMKPESYQFWVTGNRTVKGFKLQTDEIIAELYKAKGVERLTRFSRNIPNKRMPIKNSPTNKVGSTVATMSSENIVLYKKCN